MPFLGPYFQPFKSVPSVVGSVLSVYSKKSGLFSELVIFCAQGSRLASFVFIVYSKGGLNIPIGVSGRVSGQKINLMLFLHNLSGFSLCYATRPRSGVKSRICVLIPFAIIPWV